MSDWKSERKRLALRGLAYDSGRALVVPAEAREVVPVPDPAQVDEALSAGRALFAANDQLGAVAAYTRAVLHDPAGADGYLGLGEALLLLKLDAEAEAALRSGLARAPRSAELTYRLADVCWRRGERDEAARGFAAAVALDPQHVAAWERLLRVHFYAADDAAAWGALRRVEDLGGAVPAQLRAALSARTPEPPR